MADEFRSFATGLNSPAQDADVIIPNDGQDLPSATRAIYVATDGDVRATFVGGTTVTLVGLRGGVTYPFRLSRVWTTETTSTGLVGLR
jgi:hypothetical protein